MSKTIIISNRLPVKIAKGEDGYKLSPSEGGLATGLSSIYKEGNNVWIGWPGTEVEEDAQSDITGQLKDLSLIPVYLTRQETNEYYEGFSNEILWPVFHYYASNNATYRETNWQYYRQVNQKFCNIVLSVIEPGDTVWVQDYQLLLLPGLIRAQQPDSTIGFFLHIPFPSYEMFRLIPWRTELLEGVLGADLIGFHTFDDVRHFLGTATRLLPVQSSSNKISINDRLVTVEPFPMGIDSAHFEQIAASKEVLEQIELVKNNFKNTKIILSVDRLDYSKGILQRLQAFELLLNKHPDYIGKICLYMIVVPSRDTVPQYKELHDQIDKRVGQINGLHRTMDWTPVHYYYRSFPMETLSALYNVADVGLVTPIRDGMNLVSKEYVASRTKNDGVLILSEMAGASKELTDAIIVNPNNLVQVCSAIVEAIEMPAEEQQRRMIAMREVVSKFNISHWVKLFMNSLAEAKALQQSMYTRHLAGDTEKAVTERYRATRKRIIFLDYDGTLVEFKARAEQAIPDSGLYDLLNGLIADPLNRVVIISGRKHDSLDDWFKKLPVDLIAEHGAWFRLEGDKWHAIPNLGTNWKHDVKLLLEKYVERTPGSFIEDKTYSLAWHYRKVPDGLGELRSSELISNLKYLVLDQGLQILEGDKVVEIKNMSINKGKAAISIMEGIEYDFIMAIGDDVTDEDTFKALPSSAVTVKVGNQYSSAKYYLKDPEEVRRLLTLLIKH